MTTNNLKFTSNFAYNEGCCCFNFYNSYCCHCCYSDEDDVYNNSGFVFANEEMDAVEGICIIIIIIVVAVIIVVVVVIMILEDDEKTAMKDNINNNINKYVNKDKKKIISIHIKGNLQ